MNANKTPVEFHFFEPETKDDAFCVYPEIIDFARQVWGIYPHVYESSANYGYNPDNSHYTLSYTLQLNSYSIKAFQGKSYDSEQMPPIATPQHCDPESVSEHPERLLIEISPVTITLHESHLVTYPKQVQRTVLGMPFGTETKNYSKMERVAVDWHYCRMSELIAQEMPVDLALQYAYRFTFVRGASKDKWSARSYLIPFSLANQAIQLLRQDPKVGFQLYLALLGTTLEDSSMLATIFHVETITHIAARITFEEHRTSFMGKFSSNGEPILTSPVYYYGCWKCPGHYLHLPSGEHVDYYPSSSINKKLMETANVNSDIFTHHDKCPSGNDPHRGIEGQAYLHHINGWTLLAFWNNSYDHRAGSHSNFFTEGIWDFDTMCKVARREYPHIWEKLDERGVNVVLIPQ